MQFYLHLKKLTLVRRLKELKIVSYGFVLYSFYKTKSRTVLFFSAPYKVLLLTYVVNCTAGTPTARLCSVVQWSVHWAPSRTTRVLVLAGARRCALETCGEKMRAPLLGLAKSIYYFFAKFEFTTCSLY